MRVRQFPPGAIALVVAFLLLEPVLSGPPTVGPLYPNPVVGVGASPGGLAIGDFDRDGNPDLAVSDWTHGEVIIEPGNGDGTFAPERRFAVGAGPTQIVVDDFNADGNQDLAVLNQHQTVCCDGTQGAISILLGLGDGTFSSQTLVAVGGMPFSFIDGDFNSDGRPDLAVLGFCSGSCYAAGVISVLIGAGDGSFTPAPRFLGGIEPISIVCGDFNGDGRLDLLIGNTQTDYVLGSSALVLFPGRGDGTFEGGIQTGTPLATARWLAAGDFNADGRPDVAVTHQSSVSFYIGHGDGTFVESFLSVGAGLQAIVTGDFDGDGHVDVAAAGGGSDDVSVIPGRGDGTFSDAHSIPAGNGPGSLAFGDVDRDGHPDLLVANSGSGTVLTRLGKGDGTFGAGSRPLDNFGSHAAAVADFDLDGTLDFLVPYAQNFLPPPIGGGLSLLVGQGDGSFGPEQPLAGNIGRGQVVTGDFDADGKPDFAVTNEQRGSISVFLGRGDGTFGTETLFTVGYDPEQMAAGDVNSDGIPDLVVVNHAVYYPAVAGDLSLLVGRGDGTFNPEIRMTAGSTLASATIADYDGDGQADLIVVNEGTFDDSGPGFVLLFQGHGDGTFAPGSRLDAGVGAYQAVVRDFDGDGRPDLAVNNRGTNFPCDFCGGDLSLWFGNATGTFDPQAHQSAGGSPLLLVVADIDRDGHDDSVTANSSFDVSVLLNHGDRTFADPARFGIKGFPSGLAVADFDGDGLIDLAGIGFSALTVLLHQPPPDNVAPHAVASAPGATECTGAGGATVRLDGSGSTDADSTPGTEDDIAAYEWYEDFGAPGQQLLGVGAILDVTLPLGTHVVTLKVSDRAGESDTAGATVTVRDTQPPTLTVHSDPSTLWPPNHGMVPVHVVWLASDRCTPEPGVTLVSATSSEPDDAAGNDDGATTGDIQGADLGTADSDLLLRSERNGKGPGRVYTLTYRATDAAGNATPGLATIVVPRDPGHGPEPLLMRLEPDGMPGMLRLFWPAMSGASGYDPITGELSQARVVNDQLLLGTVRVFARGTTGTSLPEGAAGQIPSTDSAFFYLLQARTDQGGTGYGTESASWPRVPDACGGGCP